MDIKNVVIRILVQGISQEINAKIDTATEILMNHIHLQAAANMATLQELFTAQTATAQSLLTLNNTIVAESLEVKDLLSQIATGVIISPAQLEAAIASTTAINTGLMTSSDAIKAMVPTIATPVTPTPTPTTPPEATTPPAPIPLPPGPPVEVPVVVAPTPIGTPETMSVKFR